MKTLVLSKKALAFSLALSVGFSACSPQQKNEEADDSDGFVEIFDGQTLNGWEGDTDYWRVEDGILIGEITPEKPLERNSFLIWKDGQPSDFEFKASFRISETGNSGVNYRSERLEDPPFALRGYQADIDGKNNYTGQNYEERKRTTLAYRGEIATISSQENASDPESLRANIQRNAWQSREVTGSLGTSDELKEKIKPGDWNEIHIVARGNNLKHYVNGILMSEVLDNDSVNRSEKGYLGLQIHTGPPMKVEYKDIVIKLD
ncbi:MAG: DUF1080 domain-containing protein [Spirosomataceae bacterium]